jgi:hypothetical protein
MSLCNIVYHWLASKGLKCRDLANRSKNILQSLYHLSIEEVRLRQPSQLIHTFLFLSNETLLSKFQLRVDICQRSDEWILVMHQNRTSSLWISNCETSYCITHNRNNRNILRLWYHREILNTIFPYPKDWIFWTGQMNQKIFCASISTAVLF